ncbi:MAG: chemotaxis protein CheW [Anaerolineae bacterium]|jgi:chemotaxis signal transduction protein
MSERVPILAFEVRQRRYALMIADVVEVAAMVEIVPLPDAAPGVLGVVNRHGEMLPLLDLRLVFYGEAAPVDASTYFIVVEKPGQRAGLVVDAVDVVKYVPSTAFQPVPENRFVRAMVQHEDDLLQVLDVQPLFARIMQRVEP